MVDSFHNYSSEDKLLKLSFVEQIEAKADSTSAKGGIRQSSCAIEFKLLLKKSWAKTWVNEKDLVRVIGTFD